MAGRVLWTPPANVREVSRMGHYLAWLQSRGLRFADYAALWEWSVSDLPAFWQSIWDYFEVHAYDPPTGVLADAHMPGARWFPGATLNYAEHVLRMPGRGDDDPVVRAYSQTRQPVTLTAAQLRDQVRRVRAGLTGLGVAAGDRVAAYAPNIPETYVLMLATASLGAVFSSCAPEFGRRSVIDRWTQIGPKILVAVDGYRYGDKVVDRRDEVAAIREALPSVEHLITIGYLDSAADGWADFQRDEPMAFAPVEFAHPLYVLYSSGTTGLPKPIVHGHGGILLEHLKMLALHHDLGPADTFFWFTTTGWMMWNFLVSGPAVGASIVLFDGDPGHPGLDALWELARDVPHHLLRDVGAVRAGLPQGRGAAAGQPYPRGGQHRRAAAAGGVRLDLPGGRGGPAAAVAVRRDRRLHRVRRRRPAAAGDRGPDLRALPGSQGRGVRPGGSPGRRRARRTGHHRTDAVMPVGFWNDPGGNGTGRRTSTSFPACGGTVTGSASAPTAPA